MQFVTHLLILILFLVYCKCFNVPIPSRCQLYGYLRIRVSSKSIITFITILTMQSLIPIQMENFSILIINIVFSLAAASPPYMPQYSSWIDCWSNLTEKNQLRRGSSLLIRYYTGPQVIIDGKPISVNKDQVYKFKY